MISYDTVFKPSLNFSLLFKFLTLGGISLKNFNPNISDAHLTQFNSSSWYCCFIIELNLWIIFTTLKKLVRNGSTVVRFLYPVQLWDNFYTIVFKISPWKIFNISKGVVLVLLHA